MIRHRRGAPRVSDGSFVAPGPGQWELDRSHYYGGTTALSTWLMQQSAPAGLARVFREVGMPAETLDVGFVNGFMYTRLRPLLAPDRPARRLPPSFVLKVVTRVHPGFRARGRAATRALAERPWRAVIDDWTVNLRPALVARNRELQAVDVASLDDAGLARHAGELVAYLRENFELHFYLHGFDLGPLGLLLARGQRWGIAGVEFLPALKGASPSTSAPARAAADIRAALTRAGAAPSTFAELRSVSPEIASAVDAYLADRRWLMVSRYDLDGQTLGEAPDLICSTILASVDPSASLADADEVAAALRQRVPESERAEFDERLAEARTAMDLRDDNGPNTVALPIGLLRRVLLEAGRRAVSRRRLHCDVHALELAPDEVIAFVGEGSGPLADELAERAARRAAQLLLDPPSTLGEPERQPPLSVLPEVLALQVATIRAVLALLGMASQEERHPLAGAGIGTSSYRGRARRAGSPEEAIAAMEPGDVLVVPFMTPSYNTVLALAGAVVTSEGGPLCHAAVLARELNIPAVVGVRGALRDIPDGALVEVDPVAGRVFVLSEPSRP